MDEEKDESIRNRAERRMTVHSTESDRDFGGRGRTIGLLMENKINF